MVAYIPGSCSRNSTLYRVVFTILYSNRRPLKMCSGVRISAPRCLQLVSAKLCQRRAKYQRNFQHRLGERRSLTFMSSGKVYISLSLSLWESTVLHDFEHGPTSPPDVSTIARPLTLTSALYICMFVARLQAYEWLNCCEAVLRIYDIWLSFYSSQAMRI